MGDQRANPEQRIALPKGGGAISGIGETFAPDLFTGTGNFTVPLALPPGRNGFQPALNLAYSTGNGNSAFGLGWQIDVPAISRKTSKGLPRYDDERDVFLLAGAEDLVPIGRSQEATSYRPRVEGLFARITHVRGDTAGDYWQVKTGDGTTRTYGTARPAGAPGNWRDPAALIDPDNPRHVFLWKLSATVDVFGNRIEYEYIRDQRAADGAHRWDQSYLSRVSYADYGDAAARRFLVSVSLTYDARPDPFSDYRAGFEIRTVRRCSRIDVQTHAGADRLVRRYSLRYQDQHERPERLPRNGVSLLSQIVVEGDDGTQTERLPPLQFAYTAFEPRRKRYEPLTAIRGDLPPRSLADPDYELVELFGDGLPSVLELGETNHRYWRNRGGGRFDAPRTMTTVPAGASLGDPGVQVADMNGDGRADLLVTDGTRAGYYALNAASDAAAGVYTAYRRAPTVPLDAPDIRFLDLDGDGITDAMRIGAALELFYNDPVDGWVQVERRARGDRSRVPDVNFADPRVRLADMTGDGLQDVVVVHNGLVEYWPYLGYGSWGARITMRGSPRFEEAAYGGAGYDARRVLCGDFDGDGCADLAYVGDGRLTIWINRGGNGWSEPIVVHGTPAMHGGAAVRLADMKGTGMAGVLWTYDRGTQPDSTHKFLDLTGGVKPYLLCEVTNNLGATTRVDYVPSTQFYLQDDRRPETRWKTSLPFPVPVIARVEVFDALSRAKLTTEFSYHHGYWDGVEREFRGFGRVDRRDTQTFDRYHAGADAGGSPFDPVEPAFFAPPVETRIWHHLGPVGDVPGRWKELDFTSEYWPGDAPMLSRSAAVSSWLRGLAPAERRAAVRAIRGRVLRTEVYALDGSPRQSRPYTVTEQVHGVRGESGHTYFAFVEGDRTTQWERGDEPMTRLSFTYDYDRYGNPESTLTIAVPRGRDPRQQSPSREPYLAERIETRFVARDVADGPYLTGRAWRTTREEIANDGTPSVEQLRAAVLNGSAARRVLGQTLTYYDGPEFEGLPLRQVGDYGLTTRAEVLAFSDAILDDGFRSGDAVQTPPERPPYLQRPAPAWTSEYPDAFRQRVPRLAGYTYRAASADNVAGYFVSASRLSYDVQQAGGTRFGLLTAALDPLGRKAATTYDSYGLLPTAVVDAAGLVTTAEYDYRLLQPRLVTDPNGNRTQFAYSPLAFLQSIAAMGKVNEAVGDTPDAPGTRFTYDLDAFVTRGQPIWVRSTQRVYHATDTGAPPDQRDAVIERVEFSDGFGRLLQVRSRAEDTLFGDRTFGDAGLSNDPARPIGPAVGTTAAAAAPPNTRVSGWKRYDNKGRIVEAWEPFFSRGWEYVAAEASQRRRKVVTSFDALGRAHRVVSPDGSEQRTVFGIPDALDTPDRFAPTPWEAYSYDANDNAARTAGAAGAGHVDPAHWDTPASTTVDALGRPVTRTARTRTRAADGTLSEVVALRTLTTYDARGNLTTITDPLGRTIQRGVFDLVDRLLRLDTLDGGVQRRVLDAAGGEIEARDAKGALSLRTADAAGRIERMWARDHPAQAVTLRGVLIYGDAPGVTDALANNLRGRLYKEYDEAGLASPHRYDFAGRVVAAVRQTISLDRILEVFDGAQRRNWVVNPFVVDWEPPAGTSFDTHATKLLERARAYRTSTAYDALGRVTAMSLPTDAVGNGQRKEVRPSYNKAGDLERVTVDGVIRVRHTGYDAGGRRVLVALGNGVMTRYAHDPRSGRIVRARSERYTTGGADGMTFNPAAPSAPLQDATYEFDLVGNIVQQTQLTPGCGVAASPNLLQRRFVYDPFYRLLSATGREDGSIPGPRPWPDQPRAGFDSGRHGTTDQDGAPQATALYLESYEYDAVGNLTTLTHTRGSARWVRRSGIGGRTAAQWDSEWRQHVGSGTVWAAPPPNRLTLLDDTGTATAATHEYDACGNLVREQAATYFEWDAANRMRVFRRQTAGAEPSVYCQYLYDSSGERAMEVVRKQHGAVEVTVWIGGTYEHHLLRGTGRDQENQVVNVTASGLDIASIRLGEPFADDRAPAVRYTLGDHLGSIEVVVGEDGAWVNREEYFPYGETSFGSFARKRYRFTGRSRDAESGLMYASARYYAPWMGRWVSCDPAGTSAGLNLYEYSRSNPVIMIDRSGLQPIVPEAIAETTTRANIVAKYQKLGPVVDVTPAKGINTPGVDVHLIAGKGKAAVNVIGDVKHSNVATATGGARNVSGTISSFENAAKGDYAQLRANIVAARRAKLIDAETARYAFEGAESGLVQHEVGPSGYNVGVSRTVQQRYQPGMTAGDQFAGALEHRAGQIAKQESAAIRRMAPPQPEVTMAQANQIGDEIVATIESKSSAAAKSAPAESTAAVASQAVSAEASLTSRVLKTGGKVLGVVGATVGSAAGGYQLGTGGYQISQGQTGLGAVNMAEGGANLGMAIGVPAALKSGAIVAGGPAAVVTLTTAVAGASVALAAETARAAVNGEDTPIDVADKFYGTHFGDLWGWMTGQYSKK